MYSTDVTSDLSQPQEQPVRRTRNPQARRAAILEAARSVFAERGYPRATIREIARRAGVTHGLVVMHFSTKEQLFIAAVPGTRDLAASVRGDRRGLAARVAASFVRRMETADGADPFIALVRTAASDQEAAAPLLKEMRSESIAAYGQLLDGPDLDVKVDLIGALLIGVTFSRYVIHEGPLATLDPDALVKYLTRLLRTILDGRSSSK
jgi:AcrR family transcriptional regulator